MKPGLLLASGGIDSTVLMYELAKEDALRGVVFCEYGQASSRECRALVEEHAGKCSVPMIQVHVLLPSVVQGGVVPGVYQRGFIPPMRKKVPEFNSDRAFERYRLEEWSWIDGRNTLFFVYAAIEASIRCLGRLYTAFQFDDEYWDANAKRTPYDTSPQFVKALNQLFASGAFLRPMKVIAPYLDEKLNKRAIVRRGLKLGVEFDRTYSCEFYPPCGTCAQCFVRAKELEVLARRK